MSVYLAVRDHSIQKRERRM